MARTLVGIFDDATHAQAVLSELQTLGLPGSQTRLMHNQPVAGQSATDSQSWTDKVSAWFKSLNDHEDDALHADHYAEAWRRGHYLVVADAENDMVDHVVSIMNRHGAVDVKRRSEEWQQSGYNGRFDSTAMPYTDQQFEKERLTYQTSTPAASMHENATADASIPVVQEELSVGKRIVQRGGVRVHSYVEERPVAELIRLRDERVDVQRRPVDRAASAADLSFQDRTVEVAARGEEAVVEKRARVVEEVRVNKSVSERDQKVEETLRRKDVRVENLPPESAPASR